MVSFHEESSGIILVENIQVELIKYLIGTTRLWLLGNVSHNKVS